MLPTRCTIRYEIGTKEPLLRLCVSAMHSFGQWVKEDSEGSSWELSGPAELAVAAINVARWIGWTATWMGEDEITADTADLTAALDALEAFADKRLSRLGAKPCEAGESDGTVKVIIAAPAEHVEEIQFFFEARTLCRDLRSKIDAEIARWTIDRAERDALHPEVVRELAKGLRSTQSALRKPDRSHARDCGRDCVALIDALDRLGWAPDADADETTFGLPDPEVLDWLETGQKSQTARRLRLRLRNGQESLGDDEQEG